MTMKWGYSDKVATIDDVLECVGKGWHPLLRQLIDELEEAGWDGMLAQVKEKFGGLRFYIGNGTDEIWSLIDAAERDSLSICEVCGKTGALHAQKGRWLKTVCVVHQEK